MFCSFVIDIACYIILFLIFPGFFFFLCHVVDPCQLSSQPFCPGPAAAQEVLAQLMDILSGKPKSGFPGRRVRKLTRESSLGTAADAEAQAQAAAAVSARGQSVEEASVDGASTQGGRDAAEVLSTSEPEDDE